ncbi:MAG TPA: SusD/RagB family nutrient-binding outer membrane lipoprotein [Bacteroidales bacterium]|nr:SusD/RagB family nutrient-binding outer membrane lipoprotein [Bacteroidales bacterium]
MEKKIAILISFLVVVATACTKEQFDEAYRDPARITDTSVERQFTGFLRANVHYVVPHYWDFFVVRRATTNRWTQATGWVNAERQYRPGSAAIQDRWNNFYEFLAQFREFERVFAKLPEAERNLKRIYMIAATIYFYDHTQRKVDLHGDIPWSQAGMMSTHGGNFGISYPEYDTAESIYTKILDDLRAFSEELSAMVIPAGVQVGFTTQDIVNRGSLDSWRRYNNSLRLRMLLRVSGVPAFQARAATEMALILANPANYVLENTHNIQIRVHDVNSDIHARDFRAGLEDWSGNLAGKAMIDHMLANSDPRLRVMFEPGANAAGVFIGLDPLALSSVQDAAVLAGTVALINRSTFSRNQFFPGMLMTSAETNLNAAEAFLRANNLIAARESYERAIRNSIDFYFSVRNLSNDNTVPVPAPPTPVEITNYLAQPGISWDAATTLNARLNLIATQKWINFNVIQSMDGWAEYRRLGLPSLSFWVDPTDDQNQPPVRWIYPDSERIFNTENHQKVAARDNLTTRIFWDPN